MRIAKKIGRRTTIIVISVILLTLSTMRVAYSAIFSVKSASTFQQISAGTLNVIINNLSSDGIDLNELFPTSTNSLPTSESSSAPEHYATLVLSNTGSLDSAFSISLTYDLPSGSTVNDAISFDYLIVGIYDEDESEWHAFGSSYYTTVSALEPSETNVYPILRDSISAQSGANPTTRQFRIYIWLDENTPVSEIGKLVDLKINIKSTTINDGVNS